MSHFREVLRCKGCGKIYRSNYFPNLRSSDIIGNVCGRCGMKNNLRWVVAKPKLFGLNGWEIKEEKDETTK